MSSDNNVCQSRKKYILKISMGGVCFIKYKNCINDIIKEGVYIMFKRSIFIISLLFLFLSTSSIYAEGIGGSGSNANTPSGGKAKPSQESVRVGGGCGGGEAE
jgi:hypothetical protein